MPLQPKERTDTELDAAALQRREMDRARCRRSYWRHHEASVQRARAYRARARDLIRTQDRAAYAKRKTDVESYQRLLEQRRALRQSYRDQCFAAYGGYLCRCCGETEPTFLALDHIENDGAAHRRAIGASPSELYRWLIRNGFPPGFQPLCHNCNFAKARGGCPHELKLDDEIERMVI